MLLMKVRSGGAGVGVGVGVGGDGQQIHCRPEVPPGEVFQSLQTNIEP